MERYTLPFTANVNNDWVTELDLTIPEAIALNNLEASNSDVENIKRLMKKMTIGKKILLERCERYEELKRFGSAKDIIANEQELIEKSIGDFIAAREAFLKEMHMVG